MNDELQTWLQANQRHLAAAVAEVRAALAAQIESPAQVDDAARSAIAAELRAAQAQLSSPAALDKVCAAFGLSDFERDILVLVAGMELDASLPAVCAAANGDANKNFPTFGLALAGLRQPHWSALLPSSPLRRWRLIEVGAGEALTASPLRIDERVLHFLMGVSHLDQRLLPLLEAVAPPQELPASQAAAADRLARQWSALPTGETSPLALLDGCDAPARRALAAAACAAVGMRLHAARAGDLPASAPEVELLMRLWEREALLTSSALVIELDESAGDEPKGLVPFVERAGGILLVSGFWRQRIGRPVLRIAVKGPTAAEQQARWRQSLGALAERLNGQVDQVATHFRLGWEAIQATGERVRQRIVAGDERPLETILWDECRETSRSRLDELAQRIEPAAGWDDLVLPPQSLAVLQSIAAHVRRRQRVYQEWGFQRQGQRGLGISALFCGASGTGKTMAAEVLAGELALDLFRIDLSAVVNKYIGETEKNLRRVFDAAEESGAILLFDEADALFGKRSEVKDAHDRYANIEVSYLLQRVESYRGLAILTTNMRQSIDAAFLRRIRFVVQFPFPDAAGRLEIWRRVFPPGVPTEGLVLDQLARLNLSGGNIRNLALGAAFLAADADEPVRMRHLLLAARAEYAKLEKPLSEAEIGGWT
jgi:hypothetical protein